MPDYKQLCAELHAALEKHDLSLAEDRLLDRSAAALRAALAEPEPEGLPIWTEGICGDGAVFLKDGVMVPIEEVVRELNRGAQARAVLARWGNHPGSPDSSTPQPVPVSERLPGPGDCDEEGRCWLCGKVEGDWRLLNPEKSGVPRLKYCFSHWLPAHALPQPS